MHPDPQGVIIDRKDSLYIDPTPNRTVDRPTPDNLSAAARAEKVSVKITRDVVSVSVTVGRGATE